MSTFDVAFVIAAGGFALTVWVLLFADTLHPFLDRMGRAIVAAVRDRKIRRAARKWHPTYPRTDRS